MVLTAELLEKPIFNVNGSKAIKKEDMVTCIKSTFKLCCTSDTDELYYYNSNSGLYEKANSFLKTFTTNNFDSTGSMIPPRLFNDVVNILKRQTQIDREEFFDNENPDLICLQNGIFDLKDKTFSSFNSSVHFQTKIPVVYNKDAKCPEIEKFLQEITCEDSNLLLTRKEEHYLYHFCYRLVVSGNARHKLP